MDELIKPHNFENAKQHIQKFSKSTAVSTELDSVSTSGGLFGWFDHTVTGAELNKVTGQVQEHLIRINDLQKSFVSEFGQVYNALESLDKEYIPAILSAVKGAEESSNQAKHASEQAQKAQSDINKTIEAQKKVITILSDHKKKLDNLKHLENIDVIWKDLKSAQKEINDSKEKLTIIKKQIEDEKKSLKTLLSKNDEEVKKLQDRVNSLEMASAKIQEQTHIAEVDVLWNIADKNSSEIQNILNYLDDLIAKIVICEEKESDLADAIVEITNDIQSLNSKIEEQAAIQSETNSRLSDDIDVAKAVIVELQEYKGVLSAQEHITDVDEIYSTCEKSRSDIAVLEKTASALDAQLKQQREDYEAGIAELAEKANTLIQELENQKGVHEEYKKQSNEAIDLLSSKIKIAYYIAGSAVGVAIIELILNLMGVL